jgi:hypothetical protein
MCIHVHRFQKRVDLSSWLYEKVDMLDYYVVMFSKTSMVDQTWRLNALLPPSLPPPKTGGTPLTGDIFGGNPARPTPIPAKSSLQPAWLCATYRHGITFEQDRPTLGSECCTGAESSCWSQAGPCGYGVPARNGELMKPGGFTRVTAYRQDLAEIFLNGCWDRKGHSRTAG